MAVGVDENTAEKSAFITGEGLFEYTCWPMGLVNASFNLSATMDLVMVVSSGSSFWCT